MNVTDDAAGSARLTIDLGALAANWCYLRDLGVADECAAVVKADAYGIGAEQAVQALHRAGCRTFFVAHHAEAAAVREAARDATIYVFNGLPPGGASLFQAADLRPVLGSRDEIVEWAAHCRSAGRKLPAAIHVDTGMNRLGLPAAEALQLAESPLIEDFEPALLMSHLASAEDPSDLITSHQIQAFTQIAMAYPGRPTSLANSSGLFLDDVAGLRTDLARPGYALYGGNPVPGRSNPMQPVVRLEAPIIQTRTVLAGERVGYNGRWTATRPSRLATIPVGYADGFLRSLSGTNDRPGAAALVAGCLCPIVGRISMDLSVVDVTNVPEAEATRGAVVTLISDELDIDEVGRRAGTIGYEILTSLGQRYQRRYIEGGA